MFRSTGTRGAGSRRRQIHPGAQGHAAIARPIGDRFVAVTDPRVLRAGQPY